jgi:exodeoxyribonuclease V alpha subunit
MDQDELFGYIDTIVFQAEENGFTVARLKEPRKNDLTCLVGVMPSLQPGETVRCQGKWKHHPKFGQQFEVASLDFQSPTDLIGILKYLSSGMIKGIGPAYAERIVKKFELETLKVIDETPKRLYEVEGLGEKRIETIISCWGEQSAIRKVMVFLRGHGVSPAFAQKIYRTYGDESIEKVKNNPYALAKEIFGIGFKSADALAKGLGIPQNSPIRIDCGIEHVLWELSNDGHVCYPLNEFLQVAATTLEVAEESVEERVHHLVLKQMIVLDQEKIWVKPLFLTEVGIARELSRLKTSPPTLRTVIEHKALDWVEEKLNLKLAPEQKAAVTSGLKDKVMIVTGGPGTGKSTITRAILEVSEKLTSHIFLAAPTGRAAKRLYQITGKHASTIHSLLEMDFQAGGFKRNRDNPLNCDLIIIDEASMIDTQLMYHLLKAIPDTARVIFIGDVDQLPSVGPGNVLKDMIASETIPVTCLKQIFRQARGSRIVTNAHRINQGEFPSLSDQPKSDFEYIDKATPEEILPEVIALVRDRLPKSHRFHRFDDIQVLSPMKRGIIGTENLNRELQKELNPSPTPLIRMGRSFHLGDKVMQIRNNYQKKVFNGDVGRISQIDLGEQTLQVIFDMKTVDYDFSEMDELVLAYAVSIHKYQGSECPCIIIPIHTTHFKLLNRNLLYTGITRGKKRVILVGTKKAIAIATKNEEVKQRFTGLQEALRKEVC